MDLLHPGSNEVDRAVAMAIQRGISCRPLPAQTLELQRASLWR